MIEEMAELPLDEAVRRVMRTAEGSLALVVMRTTDPNELVGRTPGKPLVVGQGEGENFMRSDIPAFLEHTRQHAVVDDDRVVVVTRELRDHH